MAEDPMTILRETMGALGALAKLAMDDIDVDDFDDQTATLLGPLAARTAKLQMEALEETRDLLLVALDHWSGIPDSWRERAEKAVFPMGRPEPAPPEGWTKDRYG